jgi:hypothetical protein
MIQLLLILHTGGFAHVYLVRTAAPVYNTTHHVLKRIAVANDAMLTEVKKEVDIMVRAIFSAFSTILIPLIENTERTSEHCPSDRRCMAQDANGDV